MPAAVWSPKSKGPACKQQQQQLHGAAAMDRCAKRGEEWEGAPQLSGHHCSGCCWRSTCTAAGDMPCDAWLHCLAHLEPSSRAECREVVSSGCGLHSQGTHHKPARPRPSAAQLANTAAAAMLPACRSCGLTHSTAGAAARHGSRMRGRIHLCTPPWLHLAGAGCVVV